MLQACTVFTLQGAEVVHDFPCGLAGQFATLEYALLVSVTGQAKSLISVSRYCHVPVTVVAGAVHISVYVVVDPGETERVPEVATDPIPSFKVHALALVELQVIVEGEPLCMEDGFAVSVAVGEFTVTFAATVTGVHTPQLLFSFDSATVPAVSAHARI